MTCAGREHGRINADNELHCKGTTQHYQCYNDTHSTQFNTTASRDHEVARRCMYNLQTVAHNLMRAPRTIPEAKGREQGHDYTTQHWMTTVSPLQSLKMYRGSVSSELPISHCLGTAFEGGGGRGIQVI